MDETSQNNETVENRGYFEVISQAEIVELVEDFLDRLHIDISTIPVDVTKPGEVLFDVYEAQTRLQQILPWGQVVTDLMARQYNFDNPDESSAQIIRQYASEKGITLDGTMPGFLYNIGGRRIIYFDIKNEQVIPMAQKYAQKENLDPDQYASEVDAKKFLQELARKYFYHEIGHTIFIYVLATDEKNEWAKSVNESPDLIARVQEIQSDKAPSPDDVAVYSETFADIFAEVANKDDTPNRLGDHMPQREKLVSILRAKGLRNL